MTEKKHLTRPVVLIPKSVEKERTIGFERKPLADKRRIEIDGIDPQSNFKLWRAPWLQD